MLHQFWLNLEIKLQVLIWVSISSLSYFCSYSIFWGYFKMMEWRKLLRSRWFDVGQVFKFQFTFFEYLYQFLLFLYACYFSVEFVVIKVVFGVSQTRHPHSHLLHRPRRYFRFFIAGLAIFRLISAGAQQFIDKFTLLCTSLCQLERVVVHILNLFISIKFIFIIFNSILKINCQYF